VKYGSVYQRHLRTCPRNEDGTFAKHRCKGGWGYVIDLPRAADGRRRQITKSGYPTKAAARQALREMADTLVSDFPVHSLTVGEYLDSWLAGKHSLKPSTRAHYSDAIRLYLKPHIGHIQLRELRAHHIDRMYSAIALGQRNKPLTPSSIRRVHACLRSALNTAARRRLIVHNPTLYVELPPENPKRPTPWTATQCRTFIDAIQCDRLAPLYHLLITTGMRRGEAIGLRWSDVDLDRDLLVISQQITPVRGRSEIGAPKTRKGARLVPLDPATVAVLRTHRDAQARELTELGLAWREDGLVFIREDATAVMPDYVSKHFVALTRKAGLPRIRLHDLRHSHASMALEAGIDVKVVSERLGHSNTAITSDIYTHVSTAVGRAAALRIGELLASVEKPLAGAESSSSDAGVSASLAREADSGSQGGDSDA
jgi:integrase